MASQPSAAMIRPVPAGKLEPNAIGVAQDTVIGMASSAPAASIGLTLAALAAATAYGSGPVIVLTAIPMLIIANSYRRLNLWNANCGASFEWVGRAINPYLGFLTGWLMITGYVIGAVAGVEVIGPSVLAVFTSSTGEHRRRHRDRHRPVGGHAGHRGGRDQDHRSHPGHDGRRRVRHPHRLRHRGPGRWSCTTTRARSRSRRAGSPCPGSAGTAAWPPGCCWRYSSTPAGKAPCTSTRRSSTGGSTPAGPRSSPWPSSP